MPIRAGTDIAFLGGIVHYILDNELDFREYVLAYTNAATIVSEDFRDTEDLDGLFSGFDPETSTYDQTSWQYRGHEQDGAAARHRHRAGHRQRAAARVARGAGRPARPNGTRRCSTRAASTRSSSGTTPATPRRWSSGSAASPGRSSTRCAQAWTANSGRERTSALVYSVGWTQHSVGVQYIRTGAIIQLLLGNIGRPGGGVMALRGHASIQGSTDIPTLFNLLPGYLPMPHHAQHPTFAEWIDQHPAPRPEGLLGQRRVLRGEPAQGVLGRRGHRRRTTSATTTCPG